jgi:hypothetical protein
MHDIYHMDKSIVDNSNFDQSFSRKVIVGLLAFLHNKIRIYQVVNGVASPIVIPFYYSLVGSQDFLNDNFLNPSSLMCVGLKTIGTTMKIPGGIVKLNSMSKNKSFMSSQYSRMTTTEVVDTPFGKNINTNSVRTKIIPWSYTFEVEVRCSSQIERFKIVEAVGGELDSVRKFYINGYKGYDMLPCNVGLPDTYNMPTTFEFAPGDNDQRPSMTFDVEVLANMPVPLETSRYKFNESIKDFDITYGDAYGDKNIG